MHERINSHVEKVSNWVFNNDNKAERHQKRRGSPKDDTEIKNTGWFKDWPSYE